MAINDNVPDKICLYPDRLVSLLALSGVLPKRKCSVLLALLHYLCGDSLKSTATRAQIEKLTGLSRGTIRTYIKEFEEAGLLKQWRGPFDVKQKFYRIYLPVPDEVFAFYGKAADAISIAHVAEEPVGQNPSDPLIQVSASELDDDNTTNEADSSEANLSQEKDTTEMLVTDNISTDAKFHRKPTLDPQIVWLLGLKVRDDGTNIVVKFLRREGLCRTSSFGSFIISEERLLKYLLERDANSLEGFTRLLSEIQAGPQIVLPPDADLKLWLHHRLLDYPYGATWFWEKCPTTGDAGCVLSDSAFEANVMSFMKEHGLRTVHDIVESVAQEHEILRPRRSVPESTPLS